MHILLFLFLAGGLVSAPGLAETCAGDLSEKISAEEFRQILHEAHRQREECRRGTCGSDVLDMIRSVPDLVNGEILHLGPLHHVDALLPLKTPNIGVRWNHHVVLFYKGFIIDPNYLGAPITDPQSYFTSMFGALGGIAVWRHEPLKVVEGSAKDGLYLHRLGSDESFVTASDFLRSIEVDSVDERWALGRHPGIEKNHQEFERDARPFKAALIKFWDEIDGKLKMNCVAGVMTAMNGRIVVVQTESGELRIPLSLLDQISHDRFFAIAVQSPYGADYLYDKDFDFVRCPPLPSDEFVAKQKIFSEQTPKWSDHRFITFSKF